MRCTDGVLCGRKITEGGTMTYKKAKKCIKVKREMSDSFVTQGEMRQGCVMSPQLFNTYMDGAIRELETKILGEVGVKLCKH